MHRIQEDLTKRKDQEEAVEAQRATNIQDEKCFGGHSKNMGTLS